MNKFLSYQINAVNASIEHLQENKEFKLQSPTGSGKTFIISKIIDQFLENDILNSKPTSFIFIAPSTGNLDYQGYEKISSYLKKDWVKGYDIEYIGTVSKNQKNKSYLSNIDYFKENKVYFIGWQMFNKGTRITEINSEKNDIYRVISNTKNNNINIVLIIDEAHREIKQSKSLITERKKVIEDLDPFKIIKVSATLEQVNEEPDYIITYDDVKEEAAIKKNVIISQINQKLININKLDEEEQLIISAIEKQKDIKKMYQKNNIEFNPLIIVQIPDNINIDADIKTEDQLLKKIDSILEKYNYKKSYNYAIWLDKQKTNKKEEIIDNKSPIDILIFKTSIATGWDIPRANILVRIREAKTKAFNIQTLGRILRNPFFKYYENELIDNAFVFTRDEKYKEYIKQENIVNDENDLVFAKRSNVAKNSNFTIDKLLFKAKKEYEENKMIDHIVNKISNDDKFKKFFEWQHPNLLDGEIIKDAGDILSSNVDNFKQQNLSQRKIKFNEVRITLFDLYIKYRTVTKSTLLIFKVLEKITAIINKKNKTIKDFYWSCYCNWTKKLFVINNNQFNLKEWIEYEKDLFIKNHLEIKTQKYFLPLEYKVSTKKYNLEDWDGINTFYLKIKSEAFDSNIEKEFYKNLKSKDLENIHIFRNGISKEEDYYVEYIDQEGKIRKFFPDFILINEITKTCLILEAKGGTFKTDIDKNSDIKFKKLIECLERNKNKNEFNKYKLQKVIKVSYNEQDGEPTYQDIENEEMVSWKDIKNILKI